MTRPAIEVLIQWRDHAASMVAYLLQQARDFPEDWRRTVPSDAALDTGTHARMAYSCAEVIEALTGGEA